MSPRLSKGRKNEKAEQRVEKKKTGETETTENNMGKRKKM